MDSQQSPGNEILHETLIVAAGEVICAGAMIGVYALIGQMTRPVIVGALVGVAIAVVNFFLMAVSATSASQKAVNQDVKGGKQQIRLSYMIRMALIALILFLLVRSGACSAIPAILPLLFVRWILTVYEVFRGKGSN